MNSKKKAYRIILIYLCIQLLGTLGNSFFNIKSDDINYQIYNLIVQSVSTACIVLFIIKDFRWEQIGFGKINTKNIFLFLPHFLIIASMIYSFLKEVYLNSTNYSYMTWINLLIILVGCVLAGFCEEVLFRGILLNILRKQTSLIYSMLISSIGFSIIHIATIFNNNNIVYSIFNVIFASLLGFAFVSLQIKLNNIMPLILFHSLWNYVLLASAMLDIELSKTTYYNNTVNIVLSLILWVVILRDKRQSKKLIFSR